VKQTIAHVVTLTQTSSKTVEKALQPLFVDHQIAPAIINSSALVGSGIAPAPPPGIAISPKFCRHKSKRAA
jgi:hypothetical protein